jgi:hypothetical protein
MSLATASLVGTIANWMLLTSLIGGVLSTFVIVKTSDVKEEHWAEDRRASNEHIAELTTLGDIARKETAQAKLELQQVRFPRSLNIDKFKAAIERIPPTTVEVLFDANAPDAAFLAHLIWGIFFNAKWPMAQPGGPAPVGAPNSNNLLTAHGTWVQAAGGGPWGLSVVTSEQPDLDKDLKGSALVKALGESVVGPPSMTTFGRAFGDLPAGRYRIIVGRAKSRFTPEGPLSTRRDGRRLALRAVAGLCSAAARPRPVCPGADEPPAAGTKLRLVPVQAGPDAVDVWNLGAAQAKRVACTCLLPFGRVGLRCRREHQDRKRRCQKAGAFSHRQNVRPGPSVCQPVRLLRLCAGRRALASCVKFW